MKVLHIEPLRCNEKTRTFLQEHSEVDFVTVADQADLIRHMQKKNYDALFVRLGIGIDENIFAAVKTLKYIITPTTGLDHIDLAAAEKYKVQVLSLLGETTFLQTIRSTAEHTWALLLALIRHIPEATRDVQAGRWRREPFLAGELNAKKLGIIGYGRLGRIVAGYGVTFGMDVMVFDTDPLQLLSPPAGIRAVTLEELLRKSQVISLHIPSNHDNYHFFDREKMDLLQQGVILVNTSRGEVLDEPGLLDNLVSGKLQGAAVDVLEGDSAWEHSIPEQHPMVLYAAHHANLLITPHMGGYGQDSIENTRFFMAQKFVETAGLLHHHKNRH